MGLKVTVAVIFAFIFSVCALVLVIKDPWGE